MYCTVDLISDFIVNYIANQAGGRSSSYRILSGDQNISHSGFLKSQLSTTEVNIDMDTVKNVSNFQISNVLHSRFNVRFHCELHCYRILSEDQNISYSGFLNGQLSFKNMNLLI